ncbi:hypothetical protein NUACC21_37900 [Scytonema sp. NUACC21]
MRLSGQQRKELQNALVDAFPNKSSLEQMLSHELDKKLNAIAAGGNLQEIVFNLITTAESQGWIRDLIRAAYQSNPGNLCLQAIALNPRWSQVEELEAKSFSVNELVQTARENIHDSIKERCGTMRVLDMTQPIGLDDIYTSVNILEKIIGRRRLDIAELLQNISLKNFERFSLGDVREKRVPGLEAVNKYSKLMILGKPGAGKTTFLKHLALQCIEGKFQPQRIPIFITLKDFAEKQDKPTLLNYLIDLFTSYKIAPNTKIDTGWLNSLANLKLRSANESLDLTAVEQLLK